MNALTDAEVEQLFWSDADFLGYYWDDRFDDPTLVVRVTPANAETVELVCHWTMGLKLDVDYKTSVNGLLTWQVEFEPMPERRWRVVFDLASHGSVEFECLGLSLRPPAPVSAV
ncbi:MAG: hypothetical protein NXI30_28340 [bacterium]|nr:hypothetical protein [bacterium]